MLTFNEGVPGAGKTYDAVVEHILPAIKKGRTVYARVNGLNHEEIAKVLDMDVEDVRRLLIHVPTAEVRKRFVAERDADGEYVLPVAYRNTLIVIDEAHEFYVATREAMPQAEEQFFAIHRHFGADILLLTQWYKRMHTALRARIERKSVFQKLTAVGMESKYNVSFWHTTAPDKYAKVGSAMRTYQAKFFPCYKGVADGEVQTEVYKAGGRTVWASLILPICLFVPLLGAGIYFMVKFYTSDGDWAGAGREETKVGAPLPDNGDSGGVFQPDEQPAHVAQVKPQAPPPTPDPVEKMTPEQQYIWRMSKTARARVSAQIGEGADAWGYIEFREKNQPPTDILTTRQLADMGVEVIARPFGFLLKAGGEVIVATAWPSNDPQRPPNHELYRLDVDRGGPPPIGSNATNRGGPPASRVATRGASSDGYGGMHTAYGDYGVETGRYAAQGLSQ